MLPSTHAVHNAVAGVECPAGTTEFRVATAEEIKKYGRREPGPPRPGTWRFKQQERQKKADERGVTVDVTFPPGSPDGHLSTCTFAGEEIKIRVRVIASRKKTGRSGRGARKTQQPPALPPSTAN